MELKFKFDLKELSESGTFTGYASTFGNVDHGGDIVVTGAFSKSLKENPEVPILWAHRDLIGVNRGWKEDRRGLWVKGELNLQVQKGQEAYALAKQGAVKGLSIGYDPITVDYSREKEGIRVLKEVKLFEYSLTPFPMNENAGIQAVKTVGDARIELARMRKFMEKTLLSQSEREALQREFMELALIATSATKQLSVEAGEPAAKQQTEAPEDFHATCSDTRDFLRGLTVT